MIYLDEQFSVLWKDKDPFDAAWHLEGQVFRSVETRKTLRFSINETGFYIKRHQGVQIKEILKNICQLRMPVLGARNEFNAIQKLRDLNVLTMEVAAFGEEEKNILTRKSFIVTKEIAPAISLEDYCKKWKERPDYIELKREIIKIVAESVRKMHQGGVNHRDCYLCHFLMKMPILKTPQIFVTDLHRAQIRKKVPIRWRNKDLIGLYYSSMYIGLKGTDYIRFLKEYFKNEDLGIVFDRERELIRSINYRAKEIEERTKRRGL